MDSLHPARIDWSQGVPLAQDFGDVYFSREGGLAETRHVFLQQNELPERFSSLRADAGFTIIETGFGTGLNWLATMELWRQSGATGWLHYVSVEKFPLTATDLGRVHAGWPALAAFSMALRQRYPLLVPGFQRLCFPEWRATLTLFFGDVADFLPRLDASADAWFLDGFAPDRNPEMWRDTLYRDMAAHSRSGTTFATFTAAGHVRRGLAVAGFHVEKAAGFGRKREMAKGEFRPALPAQDSPGPRASARTKPWLQRPLPASQRKQACVIGAGIAGAHTAHRLALRGWQVTVLEAATPASQASGNPAAVLHPKLAPPAEQLDHFPQQAWLFALGELEHAPPEDLPWHPCGLLQLLTGNQADEDRKLDKYQEQPPFVARLAAEAASQRAGIPLVHAALWYARAGWLEAERYCRQLLAHPDIHLRPHTEAARLERGEDVWRIYGDDDALLLDSPVVIVANAAGALRFAQLQKLPLQIVGGQVSLAPASTVSVPLATVICHDGYITPVLPGGQHCLGATFHPDRADTAVRDEDHVENRRLLESALPNLADSLAPSATWQGRAALRCQSPDYLPLVGPAADHDMFMQAYAGLKDGKVQPYPDLPVLPGLYVNLAHGSRGFSQAALAAEILAAELNSEPYPVSARVLEALHPMRFWIRRLKRSS